MLSGCVDRVSCQPSGVRYASPRSINQSGVMKGVLSGCAVCLSANQSIYASPAVAM